MPVVIATPTAAGIPSTTSPPAGASVGFSTEYFRCVGSTWWTRMGRWVTTTTTRSAPLGVTRLGVMPMSSRHRHLYSTSTVGSLFTGSAQDVCSL